MQWLAACVGRLPRSLQPTRSLATAPKSSAAPPKARDKGTDSINVIGNANATEFETDTERLCFKLGFKADLKSHVATALTDISFCAGNRKSIKSNGRFSVLGTHFGRFYLTKQLYVNYPKLTPAGLHRSLQLFTNHNSVHLIARETGMEKLVRFVDPPQPEGKKAIVTNALWGVVGALYEADSEAAAASFLDKNFLSREFDVTSFVDNYRAKSLLLDLLLRLGLPKPAFHIVEETGRYTSTPVYTSAVLAGDKVIGKGTANSVVKSEQLASSSAAAMALRNYYGEHLKTFENTAAFIRDSNRLLSDVRK